MTWVCDIPGASATTAAWHLALHASLAAFVVLAGVTFVGLAIVAYRRPLPAAAPADRGVAGPIHE